VNYFLERRNYDFEQSSYIFTELLLRQSLLCRIIYGNRLCRVVLSCCGAAVAVARY